MVINSKNYTSGINGIDNKEYKTVYELAKNDYVEFEFDVANDGAYNLSLIFADIDDSSEK